MSKENTTPRLLAAAKEFNIGKETLIEFLLQKNFDVNATNPNVKLSEEMYYALQSEFAKDKIAKKKSDEISLPKNQASDVIKEVIETITPPKEEKIKVAAPKIDLKVVGKLEEKKTTKTSKQASVNEDNTKNSIQETEGTITVDKVAKPAKKTKQLEPAEPAVEAVNATLETNKEIIESKQDTEAPKAEATVDHIETVTHKVEKPNIIGKINLDTLNQSTRPKKGEKVKENEEKKTTKSAKPEEKKTKVLKEETVIVNEDENQKEKDIEVLAKQSGDTPLNTTSESNEIASKSTDASQHIQFNSPKLEGPKILGKIELPTKNDIDSKEKRNRKRIPVQKKPETFRHNDNKDANKGQGQPNINRPNNTGNNNNNTNTGFKRNNNQTQKPGNQFDRRPNNRRNDRNQQVPATEIDAREIQKKIHETQKKLANAVGGRNMSKAQKTKYRRNKREQMAEKRAAEDVQDGQTIKVTEFISVSELANLLDISFSDVISKCMSLGIMVSINQRLDAEIIELVANEFNYEVEFINLDQNNEEEEEEDDIDDTDERAPIVTIMGHVDHGKTSLLDYIREANVLEGEAGGITQHIGAYQVKTAQGKKITFLDTPGHEAFTAMRARGAKVADIAVIVVAADDAIMPQTKEAISHAQAANLPMIFAINKIDKESANPEKIKEQLAQMNILVEDWGGKFQSQEISAKKGINIDLLLEKILLESEILELKANADKNAVGSVIEASLDKGRGYVTTLLVQNGTLKQGDVILSGQFYGKVRAMFNERGMRVTSVGPSSPVQILGLNGAPQAGEKFKKYEDESEVKSLANHRSQILREQGIRSRKHLTLDEIGRRLALGNFKELPIIIKGDFDGSVEALSDSLQKLSTEEVAVNIVHKAVGQITESDVLLATASDAIIIGFQVRPSSQAAKIAEQENIEIRNYSIIYDAIQDVKSAMEGLLEPKVEIKKVANIEVREVYKITGVGTVAGCYVLEGKMTRNTKLHIIRDGIVVHTGELSSLKRFKDDVKDVNYGYECGLTIKNYNDIQLGDIIEGYEEIEVKRTL